MEKTLLQRMQETLSPEAEKMLRNIYEPTVVLTPPRDSRRSISIMPDGHLRAYGSMLECGNRIPVYYESSNCGLSWEKHYDTTVLQEGTYLPEWGRYLTAQAEEKGRNDGLYLLCSEVGPDDDAPRIQKLADGRYFDMSPIVRSAFSERIFFTAQHFEGRELIPDFFVSEDHGDTWTHIALPQPPKPEIIYPHKGPRWRYTVGCEPAVCEISSDEMMMLIRNSTDSFSITHSRDGGYTWDALQPSTFYATATTSFLLRLSDGRTVVFWNNTKPLSELNHMHQGVSPENRVGQWEDVFTNRDAAHAAITDDGGKTWHGYREILLNPVRNQPDYRYTDNHLERGDKSVHQYQALELPFGKIMVSVGQNPVSRRVLIFDTKWLYETSRSEDFLDGLHHVSIHQYLKSYSGSGEEPNGHCAWNRLPGAIMSPDPSSDYHVWGSQRKEVAHIEKRSDDRLLYTVSGIVWNFPMSRRGTVSIELYLCEKNVHLTLSDRWFNACDHFAGALSPFTFDLDTEDIPPQEFVTITMQYDLDAGRTEVLANGEVVFSVLSSRPVPTGLSYLIVQCDTDGDSRGVYIRKMEQRGE